VKKKGMLDVYPNLQGSFKEVKLNMQDGKTGMCLPSRSGKELALPQLYFQIY
jgi:hypothetical protein